MKKKKEEQKEELEQNKETEETQEVKDERKDESPETSEEQQQEEQKEEDTVESLSEKLKAQKDSYVRLIAEFDNFKRRTAKEYEGIIANANERLMLEIIEVRENFERALAAEESGGDLEKFLEGMKLIYSKLDEILTKNGLKPFTQVGDEFDPNIHDALMKRPDTTVPEDHIAEIYEKGYELKGKVIKHAKVIVSEGSAASDQSDQDKSDNDTNAKEEKEITIE